MTVLCIIPGRGGSKGIPRKNLRAFGGRPLISWPIKSALKSKYVSTVCVSTDDEEIANISRYFGAEVPFMRPQSISDDDSSSMDVIKHALDFYLKLDCEYKYVLMLEPTSPLTEASDIDSAIEQLMKAQEGVSALVGISEIEATHPAYCMRLRDNGTIQSNFGYNISSLPRRQNLTKLYHLDGSIYLSTTEAFYRNKSFYHDGTLGFVMPRWKSGEIDDLIDLTINEALGKQHGLIKENKN